jgi:hypothetical protein
MKNVDSENKIHINEIKLLSEKTFGNLIKAVVDVRKEIMVIDAELHSDEEALLLESGSRQEDLWGINIYPELSGDDFIEFDSMINLRPSFGNKSRGVDAPQVREKIKAIVNKLVPR